MGPSGARRLLAPMTVDADAGASALAERIVAVVDERKTSTTCTLALLAALTDLEFGAPLEARRNRSGYRREVATRRFGNEVRPVLEQAFDAIVPADPFGRHRPRIDQPRQGDFSGRGHHTSLRAKRTRNRLQLS